MQHKPGDEFLYENVATVDIVYIKGYDDRGSIEQYYVGVGSLGSTANGMRTSASSNSVLCTAERTEASQWYQIPTGEFNGHQAYYYKNVATGEYLYLADAELAHAKRCKWI